MPKTQCHWYATDSQAARGTNKKKTHNAPLRAFPVAPQTNTREPRFRISRTASSPVMTGIWLVEVIPRVSLNPYDDHDDRKPKQKRHTHLSKKTRSNSWPGGWLNNFRRHSEPSLAVTILGATCALRDRRYDTMRARVMLWR